MKETHTRLLKQLAEMAKEGKFGDSIKTAHNQYDRLPQGISILIQVVEDFCKETAKQCDEIAQVRNILCQLFIVAYREVKHRDPDLALSFLYSFIDDYPSVPESSLLPRWCSLAQASLAFREVVDLKNRLLVWQQSLKQFQAYNEFLNGLLSYLILLWKVVKGKNLNTAVFKSSYRNKVEEFISLTGGENGAFYLICRLAKPQIRNAIAHETIWLDSEAIKVRYIENSSPCLEQEIDLVEFMSLASIGSHLAHSYLAAISFIAAMESGNEYEKLLLPPQFVRVFSHISNVK